MKELKFAFIFFAIMATICLAKDFDRVQNFTTANKQIISNSIASN